MIQILLGRSNSGTPGARMPVLLTLDACTAQDPEYKNEVTRYPVEEGLDIADGVRMEPDTIKISGTITNSPDPSAKWQPVDSPTRYVNAYVILLGISGREMLRDVSEYLDEYPGPKVVDLILADRVMVDMVCESLSAPRDPSTGDAIDFSMSFTKIRKASVSGAAVVFASGSRGGASNADDTAPESDVGKGTVMPVEQTIGDALDAGSKAFGDWLVANDVYSSRTP